MNLHRRIGGPAMAALGETLALLLLSPMIVSFAGHTPAWDELYFFHRAACVRDALQNLSWLTADQCMDNLAKSPLMVATLLPSAPLHGTVGLAVAPITLAIATFALVWLGVRMAQRGGMKLPLAVAATGIASLFPTPGGSWFLADAICTIVILDTLLLLPMELAAERGTRAESFRRGLLWGLLFSLGLLLKLTYLYFAITFGILLLISLRRDGLADSLVKLAGMAAISLLPILLFLRYSELYWQHAMGSAFGPIAALYDDHIQRWAYLRMSISQMGWAYWIGIGVLLCYALLQWQRSRDARGLRLAALMLAIVLGYLFIAAGSPNKDPRFFWPVWLCLPFCAAVAATTGTSLAPVPMRGIGLAPLWVSIVLSVATVSRFDLHAVAKMQLVLDSLPHNRPITVLMADDEAAYNVETLILARQLDMPRFHNMAVGTVVYDIANGRTVADSIQRLMHADYVILRWPVPSWPAVGSAPEWANRFLPQFRTAIEAKGHLYRAFPGRGEQTLVYAMH